MIPTKCALYNGFEMPTLGLGTYSPGFPGEVARAITYALEFGIRHFDCAWIYKNESEVGAAIREKINEGEITRDDVFITTKLWNNFHRREHVLKMLRYSLEEMQLPYVDLYVIHWPTGFESGKLLPITEGTSAFSEIDYLETWKGMEDCVRCGFAKSIGLANFNSYQIDRILAVADIKPAVLQAEVHPCFHQTKLRKFCRERNIVISATSPLAVTEFTGAMPGFSEPTIQEEKVVQMAERYNRSPAQIALNYLINNLGVSVIPKSVTKNRIQEFAGVHNFTIEPQDLEILESLNENRRVSPFLGFSDHPYYPFKSEF